MGDFTPGVAAARARGHNITVAAYPEGQAGIRLSLNTIAQKIRDGRLDPDVRGWCGDVLVAAGKPSGVKARAQALLDAFRSVTMYLPDPVGAEEINSAAATACLRPGVCVRARDCIPQGTLLLRDDYALVPIEEIKPGDRIWGNNRWSLVQDVWFKGELAVDALTLNNGSTVMLTGDHKVFVGRCKHGNGVECWCTNCSMPSARTVSYERAYVSDLKEGDVLLRPERIDFGAGQDDPDRMYVEGLALADGWATDTGRQFCIAGRDGKRKEAQKHEVKAICERLGVKTAWHPRYIKVSDVEWAARIARLGSHARFKHAETLNLAEPAARALMRGLMADSTANTCGKGRTYSTTSYKMMVQMRVLQRMCGVSTGIKMLTPEQHGGAGQHNLWRVQVWGGGTKNGKPLAEKTLAIREIDRKAVKVPCWDLTTDDHYVYLPEHDVTISQCDDGTVFMGSALMSVGIPVLVVKQNFGADKQEHVLIKILDENDQWLGVEVSHPTMPVGPVFPAKSEEIIDPMDMVSSNTGTAGAEIVTLGALPKLLTHTLGGTMANPDPTPRKGMWQNGYWIEYRYGRWWAYINGRWIAGSRRTAGLGPGGDVPTPPRFEHHGGKWWLIGAGSDVSVELNDEQAAEFGLGAPTPSGMPAPTPQTTTSTTVPSGPGAGFLQATTDLQNQVQAVIATGDTYMGEGDYASALQAYQAAGQAGAVSVGPEIDLAGAPNVTQPSTQAAWQMNVTLAAITGATQANAQQARTIAQGMVAQYQQAITAGYAAVVGSPSKALTQGGGIAVTGPTLLAAAIGLALAGGVGWAMWDAHRKGASHAALRLAK